MDAINCLIVVAVELVRTVKIACQLWGYMGTKNFSHKARFMVWTEVFVHLVHNVNN